MDGLTENKMPKSTFMNIFDVVMTATGYLLVLLFTLSDSSWVRMLMVSYITHANYFGFRYSPGGHFHHSLANLTDAEKYTFI